MTSFQDPSAPQAGAPTAGAPGIQEPSVADRYVDDYSFFDDAYKLRTRETAMRNRGASPEEMNELMGEQWSMMAMQQYQAEKMGLDATKFWQGTEYLNPGLVEDRWIQLQSERFALTEARLKDPDIDAKVKGLLDSHKNLLTRFETGKEMNLKAFNAAEKPEDRMRLASMIFPMVSDEEYTSWTNDIQAINRALKETGSGLNVYNHPETAAAARALTATIGTGGPDAFLIREGDPMAPKKVETGMGAQAISALGEGLSGTVGMALQGTRFMMQLGADAAAWATGRPQIEVPELHTGFSYTLDEDGNPVYVGGTFGLPEMAASFMANFIDEQSAAYMAAGARSELDRQESFQDLSLQGIINGTAAAVGSIMGAQKLLFRPAVGAANMVERTASKGVAYLRSGTATANALKKSLGVIGGAATLSLEMGATTGRYEDFGKAALTGAIMYPAIAMMGAFGDRLESALLGGKLRGPLWNVGASAIRNGFEGMGLGMVGAATGVQIDPLFSVDSEEGKLLQEWMADPTPENSRKFFGYMAEWVVGNMIVGAALGRGQQREALAKHPAKTHEQFTDETLFKQPAARKAFEQEFEKKFTEEIRTRPVRAALEKATIIEPESLSAYTPLLKEEVMKGLGSLAETFKTEAEIVTKAEKAGFLYHPLRQALEAHNAKVEVEGGQIKLHVDDNLMNRLVRFQLRRGAASLGDPKADRGMKELGMLVAPDNAGGWTVTAAKGDRATVPGGQIKKMAARLKGQPPPHEITLIHTHPSASPFSDGDLGYFHETFWKHGRPQDKEFAPQLVVTAEGGFAIRPTEKYTKPKADVSMLSFKENLDKLFDKAKEGGLGIVLQKHLQTRFGDKKAMDLQDELKRVHGLMFGGEKIEARDRPLLNLMREAMHLSVQQWSKQHGLEYAFFTPRKLAAKWDQYTETGKFDFSGGEDFLQAAGMVGGKVEQRMAAERLAAPTAAKQAPEVVERVPEPPPTTPEALAEAGRIEARMKPPTTAPTTEEGVKALKKGFEQQKTYWESTSAFSAYAKKVKGVATEFFQRFFVDKDYRKDLAHKLRNIVGYGAKFLTLGPDESTIKAQADKMRSTVEQAEKAVRIRRSKIFHRIIEDNSLTPKIRQQQIDEVLQFAVLKDLESNQTRKVKVLERVEKDPTTGESKEIFREELVNREMPFGVTPESVKALRTEIEGRMTDDQRAAYANIRGALDEAWDSMVVRGLVRAEDKLPDYFPHKILDWSEADHPGIGTTLPKAQPKRGYLQGREGSRRMFDTSLRAMQDYLLRVDVNNAKHDFITDTSQTIHNRLMNERGLENTDWGSMPDDEWKAFRERMDEEGIVLLDTRYGRTGKETLDRDPLVQKLLSDIFTEVGIPITPEVVVGRNYRPNEEKGIFFVTKQYAEFLRAGQTPSRLWMIPGLRAANQLIGRWVKGPMLRGFMGLAAPARAARNLVSDLHGIYLKGDRGFSDVMAVAKNLPAAKRIIEAYRARDIDPKAVEKLSDYEFSILQEMESRGTLQANVRGQEFMRDDPIETQWMERVMPETGGTVRRMLSKMYRADFKWAKALDDYSENLLRVGYFMRERMVRFQQLVKEGEVGANQISADYAHLKTGEVLINYKHLTPLERHALNGLVFPFYTWAKGNFFGILGAVAERPATTIARAATAAAPFIVWNALFAKDEEERLWHKSPWLAARPHLILPYIRDSFGNPMVLSWDSTMGEAMSFLGMDQLDSDAFQFLAGHQDSAIFAKDLVPGVFENLARTWQSFTAPWIRAIGGQVFSSEFVTPGERAEQLIQTDLPQVSRPWADLQAMLELSNKERSPEERVLKFAPFVGFPDLFEGVSGEALPQHYLAGRIQRRESQLSQSIGNNMRRFTSGLKSGDVDAMTKAVERVWDKHGGELSEAGMTPYHLISRFVDRAVRELKSEVLLEAGITPKWLQLSTSQKAELLMTLMENR